MTDPHAPTRSPEAMELADRLEASMHNDGPQELRMVMARVATALRSLPAPREVELEWAVQRWRTEVENRPLQNIHRRTLDDTWRQVIRRLGGNPDTLIGPSHDALRASLTVPAGGGECKRIGGPCDYPYDVCAPYGELCKKPALPAGNVVRSILKAARPFVVSSACDSDEPEVEARREELLHAIDAALAASPAQGGEQYATAYNVAPYAKAYTDEEMSDPSENYLEDAAKAAFVKAQSVYRLDHDHFPLRYTWETTGESIREGWRSIAYAALEASQIPPLGTRPLPCAQGEPVAWRDVEEDDPDVVLVAHAIAEHGIGRPWNDFLPINAYDIDHSDLIEYARAAVASLRAKHALASPPPPSGGWQDIESAPRDGSALLACDARIKDFQNVVWFDETNPTHCWAMIDGDNYHSERFTHWMPLPAAPSPATGGE